MESEIYLYRTKCGKYNSRKPQSPAPATQKNREGDESKKKKRLFSLFIRRFEESFWNEMFWILEFIFITFLLLVIVVIIVIFIIVIIIILVIVTVIPLLTIVITIVVIIITFIYMAILLTIHFIINIIYLYYKINNDKFYYCRSSAIFNPFVVTICKFILMILIMANFSKLHLYWFLSSSF